MKISGWQKVSLVDYPGKIATVVFTPGCNFNCFYCHNHEFINSTQVNEMIPLDEIFNYLNKRKGMIDALVVSGGEPTLQKDLDSFLQKVKKTGVFVKLDTNGGRPVVIKNLLKSGLVDYVAMDIKSPIHRYEEITGTLIDLLHIEESINILIKDAPDYEFRTTVVPQLNEEDILKIGDTIKGAKRYALQQYKKPETGSRCDDRLDQTPHSEEFFNKIKGQLKKTIKIVELRGL